MPGAEIIPVGPALRYGSVFEGQARTTENRDGGRFSRTDHEPVKRRERGGGRVARRELRSHGSEGLGRPYIVRNIPTYDILSEENLLRIEQTADRILAEIGIEFRDDPAALDHWKRAGANIDGVLVKFEPGMLREMLKTAPASFTQHARNPAQFG